MNQLGLFNEAQHIFDLDSGLARNQLALPTRIVDQSARNFGSGGIDARHDIAALKFTHHT